MWGKGCGYIAATLTVIFASLLAYGGQCTMTEIVALVPLIGSMTILITGKMIAPHLFIAGLLLGISAFIRLNLAYVGVFITFVLIFLPISNKNRIQFNQLVAFISGGVLIVVLVVSPYLYTGNLNVFFDSVFLAPLSYSSLQIPPVSAAKSLIGRCFGYSNIILWLGFFAGIVRAIKNQLHSSSINRKNLTIYSIFFLATCFSIIKSGGAHPHYIIQIIPFMALLSGAGIDALLSSKFRFYVVVFLLIGSFLSVKTIITPYYQNLDKFLKKESLFEYTEYEIAAYLKEVNHLRKPIYLMSDHIIYWFTDTKPLTKASTHPSNISKEFLLEYIVEDGASTTSEITKILNKKPAFIVKRNETWYLENFKYCKNCKEAKNILLNTLNSEYNLVRVIDGRQIFRRQND